MTWRDGTEVHPSLHPGEGFPELNARLYARFGLNTDDETICVRDKEREDGKKEKLRLKVDVF